MSEEDDAKRKDRELRRQLQAGDPEGYWDDDWVLVYKDGKPTGWWHPGNDRIKGVRRIRFLFDRLPDPPLTFPVLYSATIDFDDPTWRRVSVVRPREGA